MVRLHELITKLTEIQKRMIGSEDPEIIILGDHQVLGVVAYYPADDDFDAWVSLEGADR